MDDKRDSEAKMSFSRRAKIKFASKYLYKEKADGNETWSVC